MRYSFTGAMPSHLKTVAVPLLKNETAEYGVVEQITDKIISEIQRDNTLKIVDLNGADSVLRGTLLRVDDVPYTYDQQSGGGQNFSVGEYKLTITVRMQYYDQKNDQVVWEQDFSAWGTYQHTSVSPEERQAGFQQAIEKLAQDVLNQTVSGW